MPVPWFTVEEEKPDIGTVLFKADDYYERLQHITGMWNDNKFLHYEMFLSPPESDEEIDPLKPKPVDPGTLFTVADITNVPQLLAYLDRANMKGALAPDLLDFMWDLHKLYTKKMAEFGFSTHWMSKKEFTFLENREKWTKLMKAMEELRLANSKEVSKVKRRKRMLQPTMPMVFTRLEDLPKKINRNGSLVNLKPNERKALKQMLKQKSQSKKKLKVSRKSAKGKVKQKMDGGDGEGLGDFGAKTKDKELRKLQKKMKRGASDSVFYLRSKLEKPYSWDYGKTRLFDRKHLRVVGKHFEFTRIYHKISKALRFSRNEPVDWRTITLAEVDKHRYSNDCWMVLKGRVYDITDYLNRHPGGSEIISQGFGIDATGIFVSVHPYVIFYKYLAGKQIGTLPDFKEHYRTEWEPPQYFNVYRLFKEWFTRPKHPLEKWKPKTTFQQNETEYLYTVTFPETMVSREEDWTITIINGFQVTVIKFVDTPYVWYAGFDLSTKVLDDTVYRSFSNNFNSVEIKIAKTYKIHVKNPIRDTRQDNNFFLSSFSLKNMYKASVVEKTPIVNGVKLYGISLGMNKFIGCPIGCYVNLRILDETRPYTPVCLPDEFEDKFKEESGDFQTLFFIIKEFKDGDFTAMLHHLPIKTILTGVDVYVSPPMGRFRLDFLFVDMDIMLLIAGGTGISVMTRIIQEYIQTKQLIENEKKAIILLHFVQHREDLIWRQVWLDIAKKYAWFHYYFSLTRVYRYATAKGRRAKENLKVAEPPKVKIQEASKEEGSKEKKFTPKVLESDLSNPHELYGYPSSNKLTHIYGRIQGADKPEKNHKAIVCGPYGFNYSCKRMLNEFGKHTEDDIIYFAG